MQTEPTDPPAREPDEVLPPLPHPSARLVEVEGVELKTIEEWDAIEEQEREAIRTEHEPDPEPSRLDFEKLYREQLRATKRADKRATTAERKLRRLLDRLSAVPRGQGEAGIDDALAQHGIGRKGAA